MKYTMSIDPLLKRHKAQNLVLRCEKTSEFLSRYALTLSLYFCYITTKSHSGQTSGAHLPGVLAGSTLLGVPEAKTTPP